MMKQPMMMAGSLYLSPLTVLLLLHARLPVLQVLSALHCTALYCALCLTHKHSIPAMHIILLSLAAQSAGDPAEHCRRSFVLVHPLS